MSENIIPTEREQQRMFTESCEAAAQEAKQQQNLYERGYIYGFQIIPSDDVPSGYKRTEGWDIFVSNGNYALLRGLTAKGVLIALGCMKEEKANDR